MPTPKPGESRADFVDRCIPIVMDDGSAKDDQQAIAMCESMFDNKAAKPLMRRAYSLLTVKSFDEATRRLSGTATTPTPDRMGDVVEPNGAVFKLPIPLLWQHRSDQPVGHVTQATVTDSGISVEAKLEQISEPGTLKDRLDEAWQSVKLGLVRGFSIGFNALEQAQIKDTWSVHFLSWEWLELSLVTIPANADATIQVVRSIDDGYRAASGRRPGVVKLDENVLRRARQPHKPGVVYIDKR